MAQSKDGGTGAPELPEPEPTLMGHGAADTDPTRAARVNVFMEGGGAATLEVDPALLL